MIVGLLVGAPATVILFQWATPLTTIIYNAPDAGLLLQILAPMFFFHYFDAPLHAILLGLGRTNAALWNFVISTAFKAVSIFVFGSQFGIVGVAFGIGIGMVLQMMLNFFSISISIGFYWRVDPYIKVGLCMVMMALCGRWTMHYFTYQGWTMVWSTVASIVASMLFYFFTLMLTNTINWKSFRRVIPLP